MKRRARNSNDSQAASVPTVSRFHDGSVRATQVRSGRGQEFFLRLSGYETILESSYTVYYIKVSLESRVIPQTPTANNIDRMWHVRKRFSQFYSLKTEIEKTIGANCAPLLPPKQYFGNLKDDFLKRRAHGLSIFLWALASNPAYTELDCVHDFLWSDVCVPPTRALLIQTPVPARNRGDAASSISSRGSSPSSSNDGSYSYGYNYEPKSENEKPYAPGSLGRINRNGLPRSQSLVNAPPFAHTDTFEFHPDLAAVDRHGRIIVRSPEELQQRFAAEGLVFPDMDVIDLNENEEQDKNGIPCFLPRVLNWYGCGTEKPPQIGAIALPKTRTVVHPRKRSNSLEFKTKSKMPDIKDRSMPAGLNEIDKQERKTAIPKLRFVIVLVGSRGDVQPYVALGKRLRKNGHYVRIAAHECFRDFIKSHCLGFAPLAGDPKELLKMVAENNMFSISFVKEGVGKHRQWISELLDDAWDACTLPEDRLRAAGGARAKRSSTTRNIGEGPGYAFAARKSSFRADILISNPASFCGWHIAEALGIPLIMSFPMPWTRTRAFPSPFASSVTRKNGKLNWMTFGAVDRLMWLGSGDLINRWRVESLRISPIWTLDIRGHRLLHDNHIPYLYCWSEHLMPKPSDWASHICVSGYWFLDKEKDQEKHVAEISAIDCVGAVLNSSVDTRTYRKKEAIENYGWEPPLELSTFLVESKKHNDMPIFIGFGSIVVKSPDKLSNLIFEAVKTLGTRHRIIVQQGWTDISLGLERLPEETRKSILEVGPVPHDWLFSRCKCIIHHGGAGTTAEALRAGKPVVIVPFFGDQFFWARTVRSAGVGRGLRFSKIKPSKLCEAVEECLRDSVKLRAEYIGKCIKVEDGISEAIKFIENQFWRAEHLNSSKVLSSVHIRKDVVDESRDNIDVWTKNNVSKEEDWRKWPYVAIGDKIESSFSIVPSTLSSIRTRVKVVGKVLKKSVVSRNPPNSEVELHELDNLVRSLNTTSGKLPTRSFHHVTPPIGEIPIGHSAFSWRSEYTGSLPSGHTEYSWQSES